MESAMLPQAVQGLTETSASSHVTVANPTTTATNDTVPTILHVTSINTLPTQPANAPPRGRAPPRYPASLAAGEPGRVPLHRRGTSGTYERLEDLLREAGYKETRVFTPESERAEAEAEEREKRKADRGSVREGVDAVVGFLAGWIPGSSKGRPVDETQSDDERVNQGAIPCADLSAPPSPASTQRSLDHTRNVQGFPYTPSFSASSTTIESMPSTLSVNSSCDRAASRHQARRQQRQLPAHLSSPPLRPKSSATVSLRTYAQVSAAQGYLRHMASTPTIPKRRSSTSESSAERLSMTTCPDIPTLPPTWLDTVTKAVLGSNEAGVHVGGPNTSSRASLRTGRPPRQNKIGLTDHTNHPRSASGAPPGLMSCLQRAQMAPSTVSTARVMCRSAPASRSSSRLGDRIDTGSRNGSIRSRRWGERPTRPRSRNSKRDGVPTLSTTDIENDTWSIQWVDGHRVHVTAPSQDEPASDDDFDDDDDEDGEPNFAQLLVNTKRQHSIQSLRRHLPRVHEPVMRAEPWDDDERPATRSASGYSRRGSMDEGEDSDYAHRWEALGVPGFERSGSKRRRGIPNGWASLTRVTKS